MILTHEIWTNKMHWWVNLAIFALVHLERTSVHHGFHISLLASAATEPISQRKKT